MKKSSIYQEINIDPKDIPGGTKVYAIINTIEYSSTKEYPFGIIVEDFTNFGKFFDFGFEEDDLLKIGKLGIGEYCYFSDFGKSVSVVRLS